MVVAGRPTRSRGNFRVYLVRSGIFDFLDVGLSCLTVYGGGGNIIFPLCFMEEEEKHFKCCIIVFIGPPKLPIGRPKPGEKFREAICDKKKYIYIYKKINKKKSVGFCVMSKWVCGVEGV